MRRFLLAAVVLLLVVPQAGHAQTPAPPATGGVSILPRDDSPYISESGQFLVLGSVQPGTLLGDTVSVRNFDDEPREVLLYGVDGSPAVGGGFGYTEREQEPEQLGAWLTLPETSLLVPARSAAPLRFELRVPADAEPGTYLGGIAADPVDQGETGPFTSRTRFVMPIRLVVPGAAPGVTPGRGRPGGELELTEVDLGADGDQVCPVVTYRNDSQDVLDPVVTVTVDGPLGSERTYREPGIGVVGPDEEEQADLPCVERPLGPSQVTVTLETPRGESSQSVSSTWWPFQVVVGFLLLLLLVLALLTTYTRGVLRTRQQRYADRGGA